MCSCRIRGAVHLRPDITKAETRGEVQSGDEKRRVSARMYPLTVRRSHYFLLSTARRRDTAQFSVFNRAISSISTGAKRIDEILVIDNEILLAI
jgi:hypothetical protein